MDELAPIIADAVYGRYIDLKITVFLCGAGREVEGSVRAEYERALTEDWFSYRYEVFRPEDLFEELLVGPGHQDLLSLENILADSVDAVLLVVESIGAIAELGSFASSDRLRKKLIVVVDKQYRKSKSFINYGPIRLMQDRKEGAVRYIDFANPEETFSSIRRLLEKMKKSTEKSRGVRNAVQAHHFVKSCIYLLEPIPRDSLISLVKTASGFDDNVAVALTTSAMTLLAKRGEVDVRSDGCRLTQMGSKGFMGLISDRHAAYTYNLKIMDSIRIAILNASLRGKRLDKVLA